MPGSRTDGGDEAPSRRRRIAATVTATFLALSFLLAAGSAPAAAQTEVGSCTTIDSPGTYVLNQSIDGSTSSSCLTITASDVTLDGDGHTVTTGTNPNFDAYAVDVSGVTNVTVRNLSVKNYSKGVVFASVDDGRIANVHSDVVNEAVDVDGKRNTVDNVTSSANVRIAGAGTTLTRSTVSGGRTTEVGVIAGDGTTIEHTVVRGKKSGVNLAGDDVRLRNVTVSNNVEHGLHVGDEASPDNATVIDLTAKNNGGDGVRVSLPGVVDTSTFEVTDLTIRDSTITDNAGDGVNVLNDGTGANATTIEDVVVEDNAGDGVHLADGVVDTTLRNVTLRSNDADGFDVSGTTNDTLIVDSTIDGNGDDAVDAQGSTNVTARDVDVGGVTADFEAAAVNVSAVDPASAPATPDNRSDLGAYLDAETATSGYLDLTVAYASADVSGLNESTVAFWTYDGGSWTEAGGTLDAAANEVRYNFTSFGTVAPLAATPPTFETSIRSTTAPVPAGGTVEVTAAVNNTGGSVDTRTVTLSVGGTQVDSRTVTLAAGSNTTVALSWTTADGDAGDRSLAVATGDDSASRTVTVEAAPSDDGGGGSSVSSSTTKLDPSVREARAVADVELSVAALVDGAVTAREVETFPDRVGSPPGATVAGLELSVPSNAADADATLRITVDRSAVGDVRPDRLRIYRHANGEWRAQPTDVVRASADAVVLEGRLSGFSYFAVTSEGGAATTATPTAKPTTTPTAKPTATPTPTRTATPTPVSATATGTQTTTAGDGAGFGASLALLAVLAAALVASRRR